MATPSAVGLAASAAATGMSCEAVAEIGTVELPPLAACFSAATTAARDAHAAGSAAIATSSAASALESDDISTGALCCVASPKRRCFLKSAEGSGASSKAGLLALRERWIIGVQSRNLCGVDRERAYIMKTTCGANVPRAAREGGARLSHPAPPSSPNSSRRATPPHSVAFPSRKAERNLLCGLPDFDLRLMALLSGATYLVMR